MVSFSRSEDLKDFEEKFTQSIIQIKVVPTTTTTQSENVSKEPHNATPVEKKEES